MKNRFNCEITNDRLNWMEPVFKKWNKLIVEYCEAFSGTDAPYYYNERANISTMSAAAWSAGMVCLEEYSSIKKKSRTTQTDHKNETVDGFGRTDLYIGHPTDSLEIAIEAKHMWLLKGTHGNTILNSLEASCSDASKNKQYSCKAGLCFYVPVIRVDNISDTEDVTEQVIVDTKALVEKIESPSTWRKNDASGYYKPDCIAWSFPEQSLELYLISQKSGKRLYYPGVIACLKTVK